MRRLIGTTNRARTIVLFRQVILLLIVCGTALAQGTSLPPAKPDDLLQRSFILPLALTPDGRYLYYRLIPSPAEVVKLPGYKIESGNADTFLECGLFPTQGGTPVPISSSAKTGLGYMIAGGGYTNASPVSPDGQQFILFALKGRRFQIQVWDQRSNKFVFRSPFYERVDPQHLSEAYLSRWISNNKFLAWAPPQTDEETTDDVGSFAQAAIRGWKRQARGLEPSVSVLENGLDPSHPQPEGDLLLIDVGSGKTKVLGHGFFSSITSSPDGNLIAAAKELGKLFVKSDGTLRIGSLQQTSVVVVSDEGRVLADLSGQVTRVDPSSISWSPEGSKFTFIDRPTYETRKLYLFSIPDRKCSEIHTEPLDISLRQPFATSWSATGDLLLYGKPASSTRLDWYTVGEDLKLKNLTQTLGSQPGAKVISNPAERSMIVESGGELWRIAPDTQPVSITEGKLPKINGIQWVSSERLRRVSEDPIQVIVSTAPPANSELYLFEPGSGNVKVLKRPSPNARLLYFSDLGKVAVFTQSTDEGNVVTASDTTTGVTHEVFRDKGKGPHVAKAQVQVIDYKSADGKSLKGLLMLPYGYEKGKRYPLIVDEYPGHVVTSNEPDLSALGGPAEGGLLFSAHGYAVLRPSMPLPPIPGANDNYLELTKGVLPAIDRTVELGIADPDRVGVFGHSYGGFGVYGLIEQTDRFKAAAAFAAPSDFVSAYGAFDPRLRYTSDPEMFYGLLSAEVGQAALGSPPWRDPDRYVRNSPIFHVDAVHTPVLIIHGDMDNAVPVQQAEEFYTALHRLNKPVKFLRYWGEGHLLFSPANRVDLWKQLYSWFDEFLMKPDKTEGKQ